jgi:hypothetical protein
MQGEFAPECKQFWKAFHSLCPQAWVRFAPCRKLGVISSMNFSRKRNNIASYFCFNHAYGRIFTYVYRDTNTRAYLAFIHGICLEVWIHGVFIVYCFCVCMCMLSQVEDWDAKREAGTFPYKGGL